MTYSTVEQSLREMVRDRIATATGLPVAYPNVRFVPPRDAADNELPWLRLAVLWRDRGDIYAVNRRTITGEVVVSVFVPIDSGTAKLHEIGQAVVDAIEQGDAGRVQFFSPALRQVTASTNEAAGWLQSNISAEFFADEV